MDTYKKISWFNRIVDNTTLFRLASRQFMAGADGKPTWRYYWYWPIAYVKFMSNALRACWHWDKKEKEFIKRKQSEEIKNTEF